MIPLDYLLAVAILTGPVDQPVGHNFAYLSPTLRSLAIDREILDQRELSYVLKRREDFAADVAMLRRRHKDLADAPPLHDCMMFPDRALINDMLSFNREYREHLEKAMPGEAVHWWGMREAQQEADRLYAFWDYARDIRNDYYYITVRRQALKKVSDTIGHDRYYSGQFPPHIPIGYFRRID